MLVLRILLVLLITASCLSTGCSDDPATPIVSRPTRLNVDLPAATTAFTGVLAQARHPEAAVSGPFVLRGYNKHYDFSLSAMVMSLEIANDGEVPYGGPVSLAFLRLLPEGVVLLGQTTGQPVLEFAFGDEDGIWSPDESSLPLTIAVGITPEVRFSFTAELAVGFGPDSGVISGTVWRDTDGNGERDAGGQGDGGDANNQSQPDFSPTPAATATVVQTAHTSGDVIIWNVTDLVNSWLDGTTPNHGVVVHDVNPGGSFRQLWFWSRDGLLRDYGIPGAQPGPRLVLLYE